MANAPFKATDHFRGSWNAALGDQPLNAEVGYNTPQDMNLPAPGFLAKAASTSNPFDSPMAELTETCAKHGIKANSDFKKILERSLSSRAGMSAGNNKTEASSADDAKPKAKPRPFRANNASAVPTPLDASGKPDMKAILSGVVPNSTAADASREDAPVEATKPLVESGEDKLEDPEVIAEDKGDVPERVEATETVAASGSEELSEEQVPAAVETVKQEVEEDQAIKTPEKEDGSFQAFFDEQVEAIGSKGQEDDKEGFDLFAKQFEKDEEEDFSFDPRAEESPPAPLRVANEVDKFNPFGESEDQTTLHPQDDVMSQGTQEGNEENPALDSSEQVEREDKKKTVPEPAMGEGSDIEDDDEEEGEDDGAEAEDDDIETAAFVCPSTFDTEVDLKTFLMSNTQSNDYMKCTLWYDSRASVWNFRTKKGGKTLMQAFLRTDGFKVLSNVRQWAISMSSVQDFNKQTEGKQQNMKKSSAKRDNALYLAKLKSNGSTSHFDLYDTGKSPGRAVGTMQLRRELLSVKYERQVHDSKLRRVRVCVPADDNFRRPKNKKEKLFERMKLGDASVISLVNHVKGKPYRLPQMQDYEGLAVKDSIRNMILHDPEAKEDDNVLVFGRVTPTKYNCYFKQPLSPLAAFAVCISSIDSRVMTM